MLVPLALGGRACVVPMLERAGGGGLDLLVGGCQVGRWGFGQCTKGGGGGGTTSLSPGGMVEVSVAAGVVVLSGSCVSLLPSGVAACPARGLARTGMEATCSVSVTMACRQKMHLGWLTHLLRWARCWVCCRLVRTDLRAPARCGFQSSLRVLELMSLWIGAMFASQADSSGWIAAAFLHLHLRTA